MLPAANAFRRCDVYSARIFRRDFGMSKATDTIIDVGTDNQVVHFILIKNA